MTDYPTERETLNDSLVRAFVDSFASRDAELLGPYFTDDISFENYGDSPVHGRSAVVNVWAGVFATFAEVRFETLSQAVNGDVVFAEQVHGLAFSGGSLAPIKNMAVYELRDGRIAAWRDYTNPNRARALLKAATSPTPERSNADV
ncbi:nuclear transport factor 2 family protein [Jatrophihabitans sp. DSM 45814]